MFCLACSPEAGTGPDLGTFFWEIFFGWIFCSARSSKRCFLRIGVSKSGLVHFCQKETAALSSNAKEEASPSERFFPGGAGGSPLRLFASGLSPRESLDPRPGQGRGITWQVITCAGPERTTCRCRQARPRAKDNERSGVGRIALGPARRRFYGKDFCL